MADYLGVLTELHGRRKALVSEVAELDSVIMGLERLTNRPGARNPEKADPGIAGDLFTGKTLPQAVLTHMESVNRPQTTREVINALKAGGVPSGAKSFSNQVYNALHRASKNNGPCQRYGDRWRLRASGVTKAAMFGK